jgi:hypothetical protein
MTDRSTIGFIILPRNLRDSTISLRGWIRYEAGFTII